MLAFAGRGRAGVCTGSGPPSDEEERHESRALHAASGMLAGMHRQLALSNQLANVNTTGFKTDQTTTRAFRGVLAQAGGGANAGLLNGLTSNGTTLGSGALMERTGTDLRPGSLRTTGRIWTWRWTGKASSWRKGRTAACA